MPIPTASGWQSAWCWYWLMTKPQNNMDQEKHIGALKDLYQLLGDSVKGYREAASQVKSPELKVFMSNLSAERATLKQDLGQAVHRLSPDHDKLDEGTLKGDLHRAWMDIREALSSSSDRAVLDECHRGEDFLVDRYRTVLDDEDIPGELRVLLRKQVAQVGVARAMVEDLQKKLELADN